MFKKVMSALLIVSLLSWTVGCTSFQPLKENESLAQYHDKKIEVRTKDGWRYILSHWTRNASGDYTGTGKRIKEYYRTSFSGTIAADRIEAVKVTKIAAGKSLLLVGGLILVSFGALAVWIAVAGGFGT